jgi:hypothetical protein
MGDAQSVSFALWLGFRDITHLKMGSHDGSTLSTFVAEREARNEAQKGSDLGDIVSVKPIQ